MILFQKLPMVGCNLIVKGEAHNFDMLGFYKGTVKYNFINAEKVKLTSYITQGHLVEECEIGDTGDIILRNVIKTTELMDLLKREQEHSDCLALLTRNLIFGKVIAKQYIIVYKRR